MRLPSFGPPGPLRTLRLWQLGVVVAYVCASALSMGNTHWSAVLLALPGWIAGPFLVRGLLERLRVVVGLDGPDRELGRLAVLSLFFSFVGLPLMLMHAARGIGAATAEPGLQARVKPLALLYAVGSFFGVFLGVLIPVVGVFLAPLIQIALLGLATQVLIQHVIDASDTPVPRGDSTGHAEPVGIRTI